VKHQFFFGAAVVTAIISYVAVVYIDTHTTVEDTLTGCKYVLKPGGRSISPKIGPDGKQVCKRK
jgi:hypothetical protein